MRLVKFREWIFEIDEEINKKYFEEIKVEIKTDGQAVGHFNYFLQIENIYTEELKSFFNDLGINLLKFSITSFPSSYSPIQEITGFFTF